MLTVELNRIHECAGTPEIVSGVASGLSSADLWQVIVMHLAALLRQEPTFTGSFDTRRVKFECFDVRVQDVGFQEADIEYRDRNVSLFADGIKIERFAF